MAPVLLTRSSADDSSMSLSPIYIVGIIIACLTFASIGLWLAWRKWTRGSAFTPDYENEKQMEERGGLPSGPRPNPPNAFSRTKMTASIILPAVKVVPESNDPSNTRDSLIAPYLPPIRRSRPLTTVSTITPSSSSRPYTQYNTTRRSGLRNTLLPGDLSRATMTENEILDYHLNQGDMPVAFAPIAISSLASLAEPPSPSFSVHGSVTASVLNYVESQPKFESGATVSSLPWQRLSPSPAKTLTSISNGNTAHGRFSSLSASIRFPGGSPESSPTRSVFTFGKKHQRQISTLPTATADNQRTIVIPKFNPLLPDELVLKSNETVTIVESFDDGWCIVARMNLGMLEVGAVPEFVFGLQDGELEEFATMRPMRSTSLGVTVNLRVLEPVEGSTKNKPSFRDSTISWANF